jgi:hypothetical protein
MDEVELGIKAYKEGRRDEARDIFTSVLKQNPENARAWAWMSNVVDSEKDRIYCLNQVLRFDPDNKKAQQLLDQLLVSPLSSTPSNTQTPSPSAVKAIRKNSSFTPTQLLILTGLVVTIFLLFGAALLNMFVKRNVVSIVPLPTSSVTSSANLIAPPTATLIPTYAYAPTWTPPPSPTSFVVPTLVRPTSIPQQPQGGGGANPPSANSGSDCASQLAYAAAVHQYNLDAIDYIHSPMVGYYQSLIDQATRDRDALGLTQAKQSLANEQSQVKAEKASENKRYKAEVARINASCQ